MTEENVLNNDNADGAGQSRAVGLFLLKRYNEAAAVYDDLLRQAPDNIAFWVNKMICVLQYSEPDAAFFNDMLQQISRLPAQGYLCLADVLYNLERHEEALVFVNKALESEPDNVDACLLKARLLDISGRSEELYQFICSFYPRLKRDERVLCFAAFYAVLFWNMEQADYFLKKALKINKYSVLQNNFFYISLAAKNQEEKIVSFGVKALDDRENNPVVWLALGNAYTVLGQNEAAGEAYETLSRLTEISDDIRLNWANVLIEEQKFEQAFDLLNQISDFSDTLFLLMRDVLFAMRRTGRGNEAREKAVFWRSMRPENQDVNYLCTAFLGEKTNESAPLSFVRLINEVYAVEQAERAADRKKYFGPEILDRAVQALKLPIGRSMNVLDIGCGSGAAADILSDFSRPAGTLTGIDVSDIALDFAADKQVYNELEEADLISFCSADPEKYDLIAGLDSLFYFGDLTPVLTAVKTALKPGGIFVFTVRAAEGGRDFDLDIYGRFKQGSRFVSECITAAGLDEKYQAEELLYRKTETEEIYCHVFAVQKKA
ncbi:MAG: methyltransferase domain-containing protein [Alphaproteobacteria bacterium]|nr:methyltransferase domain-containing protein [Alphaproteobacteria bacterium]